MHNHFRYSKQLFEYNHCFVAFIEDLIKKIEKNMYCLMHFSELIVWYAQGDANT